MSPFIISFIFAAGTGTWIFTKLQRYSGNNTKQSAIGAGVAGLFILIVFYFVFKSIIH